MKYISQTIDFISYKNGEGVEVESQIEQYCIGAIPSNGDDPVPPSESDSGWSTTMPNPWDDKGKKTHHIWKRQKTKWSNGQITYLGVMLMSDFDIANILAQQAGKSIGEWCIEKNVTIIDGSTIMTGSVAADQIAVNAIETKHIKSDTIEADHIKADAITADKIKVDNLSAISADLGTLTAGTIDASKVTVKNLDADNIASGTIDASKIAVTNLNADNIASGTIVSNNYYDEDGDVSGEGMKLDLSDGTWDSAKFKIDLEGNITAAGGDIGGWKIDRSELVGDSVVLSPTGLTLNNGGMISLGDMIMSNDNTTPRLTTSKFYIGNENGGLELTPDVGDTVCYTIAIENTGYASNVTFPNGTTGWGISLSLKVTGDSGNTAPITAHSFRLYWVKYTPGDGANEYTSGSMLVNINATQSEGYNVSIPNTQLKTNLVLKDYMGFSVVSSEKAKASAEAKTIDCDGWDMRALANDLQVEVNGGVRYCGFVLTNNKSTMTVTGHMVPAASNSYSLGSSQKKWSIIYSNTATINGSDRNIKKLISPIGDPYEVIFDSLAPVSYKFIENESDRTHTGFIAQDVKEAVESAGLTTKDFAAYCEWENDDGTTSCGLRYSELIALCVNEIQKLKKRVTELEDQLNNTK